VHIGEDGYVDATRKIVTTARDIETEVRKVSGLFVYGQPKLSVVGIGSNDFDIYRLSDSLVARGWNLNALQYPSSIHLCVTLVHTKPGIAHKFVTDLKECVAEIMKNPKVKATGHAAMYGVAQSVPQSILSEITGGFFDAYYSTSTAGSTASSKSVKH
jgi:sphinganine-1-phosphate aldolase